MCYVIVVRSLRLCWFVFALSTARLTAAQSGPADHELLLRQAVAAYEAGELARAQELFEAVHREQPTARTLRALGVLAFRQGHPERAVELLSASLESQVKPLTLELAAGARELLADAKAQLAQQATMVEALAPEPAPRVASSEESAPRQEAFARAHTRSGETPPRAHTRRRRMRRAGYGLLAAAGAAAIVAGVGTGLGIRRIHEIEDICRSHEDGKCFESELEDLEEEKRLPLLSGLSIGGAVAAGVSGAAGTVLLFQASWREHQRGAGSSVGFVVRHTF